MLWGFHYNKVVTLAHLGMRLMEHSLKYSLNFLHLRMSVHMNII